MRCPARTRSSYSEPAARAAALDELVPAAVKSLKVHLGEGDPTAWRAAHQRVRAGVRQAIRDARGDVEIIDPLGVAQMTREQRARLLSRVLDDHPELAALVPNWMATPSPLALAPSE